MRRSFKLIVDTHKLGDSSATGMQAIAMDSTFGSKTLPQIYGSESVPTSSGETDSRMRILKDSSKDFLTPYNPNANTKSSSSSSASPATSATNNKIQIKTPNAVENEVVPSLNIRRTKLVGLPVVSEPASFLTQTMVFAVVGSIVLFLGIVVLYLIMRPTRKHVSVMDKQVLIQTEVLPSQLPLNPACAQSSAKTQPLNDQRTTLHV